MRQSSVLPGLSRASTDMPRNPNEALISISISVKGPADLPMAEKILETIREMEEYAADNAVFERDNRRGDGQAHGFRYETFAFHKQ